MSDEMNDFDFGQDGIELALPAPQPHSSTRQRGWSELCRPLAMRISELPDGKCIRLRRSCTGAIISAVRTQLERLGFRLITRNASGGTYFWRGESLGGTEKDLLEREIRVSKDKPHYNI